MGSSSSTNATTSRPPRSSTQSNRSRRDAGSAHPGKSTAEVHDYHDIATGVLGASLAKRATGYTSLGFPDPRSMSEGSLPGTSVTTKDMLRFGSFRGWSDLPVSRSSRGSRADISQRGGATREQVAEDVATSQASDQPPQPLIPDIGGGGWIDTNTHTSAHQAAFRCPHIGPSGSRA